ncbi:uncharacterized protein FOMMEDRAFT_159666 [Fomitiporia mediterranea MF3/22]|uniref:uncharacterized protein n=1 Tax=Fomitiporia mediterranea (strain MF3/22) TaxID=694068 RepID=UPI000440868F|nr:uncharacterized protein FOMMEDRAFT_159666 [Fomitiporia mediterranea MF3/22]EJD00060.1 hypothetical protein FOMMEDRAFT_159666 [Fomitiporia mediterranea MF3/22]
MTWLPRRGSREALYFDSSKLEELLQFFEDIEMLAADFQKDAEWMCKQVTYYAATSCSSLWATVPELKKKGACDWSIVKEEIRKLYPELINGQHYMRANIMQLVDVQSEKEMMVQTEFGHYCCEFQVQAEYLKEQGKMSACKLDCEFWRGIRGMLRTNLTQRLEILYVDKDVSKLFKFADVVRLADHEKPEKEAGDEYAKIVRKLNELQAQVNEASKSRKMLMNQACKTDQSADSVKSDLKHERTCNFCGKQGHFIRDCRTVNEPVFTVGTIDEAKDRSNASEGEKHKAILGADLDAEVTRLEEHLRDVKRQREEARTMKANTKPVKVRLKQSAKSSKIIKQVLDWMMDSVVMLTHCELFAIAPELECQYVAKLMRTTQMQDEMLNKAGSGPVKAEEEEMSEEARTDSREDQHTGTSVACKDDKAQSSPAAELRTSRLCRKAADYVGLSQIRAGEREREQSRGASVTNKAGSVPARMRENSVIDEQQRLLQRVVASWMNKVGSASARIKCNNKAGSVPVRLATVKLNDKLETESLLDQGAVMNVMHEDVWKRLGVPKEQVWTNLRPANAGSIAIKGVIPRLKVSVGGISMVMLVHVVKDTMFDMIIGRAFFVLTECETKDFKDSNQILTLTDPADQNQKCQVETRAAVG